MKRVLIYFLFWVNVNGQEQLDKSIQGIGEGQIVGLEVVDQLETALSFTALRLKFRISQQKNYSPNLQTISDTHPEDLDSNRQIDFPIEQ